MKFKVIILFLMIAFCACQQVSDMLKVSNEISRKYSEQVSPSVVNSKYIVIKLINSKKKNLPDAEKEKYAHEIAIFVYDNFETINDFSEITIDFVIHSDMVIFQYTNAIASFNFTIADLANESRNKKSDGKTL